MVMKNLPNKELVNQVYEIVRMIPKGKVTSYGAIAKCIGLKSGARWVGWVMNLSHAYPDVPAHRVVNSKGLLTGKHHFGLGNEMQLLLEAEGIRIIEDKVQNYKALFWDPFNEIEL
jgi:methylated-DNA-protein-cysteine methyltransferase-like protein